MRRLVLRSAAAAAVPSLLLLAWCCQGPPRARVGPGWTPGRLAQELERAGERWEAHPLPGGRLLLRRPGGAATWDELELLSNESPRRFGGERGRLLVTTTSAAMPLRHPEPDVLQLRHLAVRGHPDELRRVLDLLAP